MAGAGAPRKAVDLRKALFKYFVDEYIVEGALTNKGISIAKAKSFYDRYSEDLKAEGKKPP